MSEWKEVKLGECITTKKGFAFKSALYTPKGVPVVRVSDFTLNSITDKDLVYYPVSEYNNYKDYVLTEKDILVQTVGSWQYNPNSVVGKVVRVPYYHQGSLLNQNIVKIIPIECIDKDYLYYRIKCVDFSGYVIGEARGAANQASITLDTIKRFAFLLPPKDVQERIGATLSRYDSLIENYQKQIKLLEEAAQRLYKEWFVDLHFPGHENTKIIDGVPEGWEKKKVREIGKVITGKTPSTSKKEYYGGQIPFITIPDMHTGIYPTSSQFLSDLGANSQSGKFIPANSLMVSCIGTAGLVCITKEECQTNQQINSLVLNDNSLLYYMYNTFLSLKEHLNNIGSNGATMTNVNKSKFESIEILIPNNSISNLYNKAVEQSFRGIKTLSSQICLLTEARDRLLPKLMSGEIEMKV